jgi:hypothetical protein
MYTEDRRFQRIVGRVNSIPFNRVSDTLAVSRAVRQNVCFLNGSKMSFRKEKLIACFQATSLLLLLLSGS